ncbi:MAG: GPW/gp25 family protein [Lachnospiraceae bacterium]|nr:GPW/gp25 family protein [Lachnospiraceae bacterium]
MPKDSFLGTGMKFPPQVNKATGRFVVSSEEESVKESIYLILMTQRSERFIRPDFGSSLMSYTFMDINVTNVNLMIRSLREQISLQEPRVRNVKITTDSQVRDGCLMVDIDYEIIDTNTRDNLVFPFYLEASAEEEEAYEPEQYEEEVE